jgi:hypothetical protein
LGISSVDIDGEESEEDESEDEGKQLIDSIGIICSVSIFVIFWHQIHAANCSILFNV